MKIGFIGAGNMAKAMMGGIIGSKKADPKDILAYDVSPAVLEAICSELQVCPARDNHDLAKSCDVVVLAVKPQHYAFVIQEIAPDLKPDTVVVTIAPGQTLARLKELFGREVKLVRTMPNTPAMVGEGMTAVCANDSVTADELAAVCSLLEGFGKCAVVAESMMDAVVGISGSSPAYVFLFIEALADGAVAAGMPRTLAYEFAAQAVLGSAKMVLETGLHPGALKDMVCSPGGTTIQAVKALEEQNFRGAVLDAVEACVRKAREM